MIEDYEDEVVALYYKVGKMMQEGAEEEDLGPALCGKRGAVRAACSDDVVAAWTVAELELLERHASIVDKHALGGYQAPGAEDTFKSEARAPEPKRGEVAKIVASDFYKRVIFDRDRDALMYFAYPTLAREFHAAYFQTHERVAEALEEATDIFVGMINVELNEVPPPYADMVTTPCILLYRANKKESPRWIPLRTAGGEYITGDSAPTLADVLSMVSKNAKTDATKHEADRAMVRATPEELYSTRAVESNDEL
jgi:hypothetical protein